MASHFTAIIEIVQVIDEERDRYDKVEVQKSKAEVARVVVRADSLEELKKKTSAHIALV